MKQDFTNKLTKYSGAEYDYTLPYFNIFDV